MKKEKQPEVLFSLGYDYKEYDEMCSYPLYTVQQYGKDFVIKYHGCCAVHISRSLEESKQYIRQKAKEFNSQ